MELSSTVSSIKEVRNGAIIIYLKGHSGWCRRRSWLLGRSRPRVEGSQGKAGRQIALHGLFIDGNKQFKCVDNTTRSEAKWCSWGSPAKVTQFGPIECGHQQKPTKPSKPSSASSLPGRHQFPQWNAQISFCGHREFLTYLIQYIILGFQCSILSFLFIQILLYFIKIKSLLFFIVHCFASFTVVVAHLAVARLEAIQWSGHDGFFSVVCKPAFHWDAAIRLACRLGRTRTHSPRMPLHCCGDFAWHAAVRPSRASCGPVCVADGIEWKALASGGRGHPVEGGPLGWGWSPLGGSPLGGGPLGQGCSPNTPNTANASPKTSRKVRAIEGIFWECCFWKWIWPYLNRHQV